MADSKDQVILLLQPRFLDGTKDGGDMRPATKGPSNQTVLMVTCASFFCFVVAEIVGALAGNSLSLLGDAAAMSVDVFSYFANMWAERIKSRGGVMDRRTRMILEVYIPSFSICLLLGVTGYVTSDAIKELKGEGGDDEVNVYFMWGFASANALVDFLSAYFFIRGGRSVFFHSTVRNSASFSQIASDDPFDAPTSNEVVVKSRYNLNMASAFTHLGGDSLRTGSVFVAAAVATFAGIDANTCDAWAAIIVTITIICLVIPLIIEIVKAASRSDDL